MSDDAVLSLAYGVPTVVRQALSDTRLPQVARLTMWHLIERLDFLDYVEVKVASLAREMRVKETTAGEALRALVAAGYLLEHQKRKPRAFRFPQARRVEQARAA
jgi:hypothetical protein